MSLSFSKATPVVVAGCGSMGLPMAERLHFDGFNIEGFDIRSACGLQQSQVTSCRASAVSQCSVLISVVRDACETDNLCFDEQGVFNNARYPGVFIVCSTLKPSYVMGLRERLPSSVSLIDAPMSGAPIAAREGNLTFMLGGDDETVEKHLPLFKAMGSELFRAGELGAGMTLKVLNNYVAASSVVAVRRVLEAAEGAGVSKALLREVMSKSSGATWFGNRFEEIDWAKERYKQDNTIGILEKDLTCAFDIIGTDPEDVDDRSTCFDRALLNAIRRL